MEIASLKELYSGLNKHINTVFVVPLIRFDFPKTDYLYLFYKDLIDENKVKIESISVFAHFRFVLHVIFNRNTLLHYHWLEFQDVKSLLGMPFKLLCIGLYKLFGGDIVWTVHNLKPHDKKYLSLHLRIHRWMARIASIIHVHSEASVSLVSSTYDIPPGKIAVLKHPDFPAKLVPQETARNEFLSLYGDGRKELKSPVFLVFGGISEYKGIREIIELLSKQKPEFTLIIAGYVKKGQESLHNFIIEQTIDDSRVLYVPAFIPEEHYPLLLNASDICIFNYDEILSSGGIKMAQSYNKKIIAPYAGDLRELKNDRMVSLFNSKEELQTSIISTLSHYSNG